MKHLLPWGENFLNACTIHGKPTYDQTTDFMGRLVNEWKVSISRGIGWNYIKHVDSKEKAQKECDRINKWLEQFIDYEAEGTEE